MTINGDGSTKCYSCGVFHPNREVLVETGPDLRVTTLQKINRSVRGIATEALAKYRVKEEFDENANPIAYLFPKPDGTFLHRRVDRKEFFMSGTRDEGAIGLFGSDIFPAGSAKAVTITEGYFDAIAAYQMHGSQYPVVAVQSATSAKAECAKAYEYLNSFDKIYLCLDADLPGEEASKAIAQLFDFNKVYVVKLDKHLKDANAYLQAGATHDFVKAWWAAQRFMPEGIISSFSKFDEIIDGDKEKPSVPYPFPELQAMTHGIRTGEIVLFTAQEGIGKTEIFRALEYNLLKNTKEKIGVIHLEENKARTLKGYVGYELQSPIHLPEFQISPEDTKRKLRNIILEDDRLHIYSHFGSDDPDTILSTIRFMAGACGCTRVFLDHITLVVTGLQGEDERRALDYISTRSAMLVEELDFTLFMISHVNDEGQTRGSRNIAKVADLRVDLERDIKAESEVVRNITHLTVSKNRFAGKTGPAGALRFDPSTYTLEPVTEDELPF